MKIVFTAFLLFSVPAHCGWKQACASYLQTLHEEAETEKYGRLFGYTLRAILKDHRPIEKPAELAAVPVRRGVGFLLLYLPPEKPNRWIAWLTPNLQYPLHLATRAAFGHPYSFSPTGPISYYVIRPLVHGSTQWVFGKTKEFTLGVNILIVGVVAATVYNTLIDDPFRKAVATSIVQDIPNHSAQWTEIEESDFRYSDIETAESVGTFFKADAQVLAFIRNRYLAMYYAFISEQDAVASESARSALFEFPAFYSIKAFVEEGVPQDPFYFYLPDFQSTVSPSQVNALIQVKVWQLALQEGLAQWAQSGMPEVESRSSAEERVLGDFFEAPYAKALLLLHRNGKISQAKLVKALQEDVHWQGQFRSWRILRLGRWKVKDGVATQEVLTLKDLRLESSRALGNRAQSESVH